MNPQQKKQLTTFSEILIAIGTVFLFSGLAVELGFNYMFGVGFCMLLAGIIQVTQ